MCYCLMALIAKMIQLTVFGTLRVGEVQVSVHFYLLDWVRPNIRSERDVTKEFLMR